MNVIHYIGLDVHKKTISYCVKTATGQIVERAGWRLRDQCFEVGRAAAGPGMAPWKPRCSVPGSTTP